MAGRTSHRSLSLSNKSEGSARARSSSRSISEREERVVSRASRDANTTVNRQARYNNSASFQTRKRNRAGDTRSSLRYSTSPERSRSRSPWRPGKDANVEKRPNEVDHYGKDSSTSHRSRLDRDVDRRRRYDSLPQVSNERRRDRSRSPWRPGQTKDTSLPSRGTHQPDAANTRGGGKNAGQAPPKSNHHHSHSTQRESLPPTSHQDRLAKTIPSHTEPRTLGSARLQRQDVAHDADKSNDMSEAELIEQRRKRREAIKAKHKVSAPLLVQALEQSAPSITPSALQVDPGLSSSVQSPPSTVESPSTPQEISAPGSPATFAVKTDEDLVNVHQLGEVDDIEGPSAADFDPSMDVNEDRPLHKRQDFASSRGHDAANGVAAPVPAEAPKAPNVLDMFAEDDDEFDMFAAEDTGRSALESTKVRALDENLLDNWDYPDGHYRLIPAELLDARYTVKGQIGKGTFATVVRAVDIETGKDVAIKIARNNDTMLKAGTKEVHFLELLNGRDQEDKKHVIRLLRYFTHKSHLCLVFENLSNDLREVLKKFGRNVGISMQAIKVYAHQMFLALAHMKACEVLHADLKPDNILVNDKRNLLKICDLGTATFQRDAEITPYLVSRFYRAPEIILGIDFDYSIDMWSIGCTLYELYTGRILFSGSNNNNMLRVIQECRGRLPNRLIKKASLAGQYFGENFTFYSQEREKITDKIVERPLHFTRIEPGKDLKARLFANSSKMSQPELKDLHVFADLLDKCLQLDPERRLAPKDALKHPFIYRPERSLPTGNAPSAKAIFAPAFSRTR